MTTKCLVVRQSSQRQRPGQAAASRRRLAIGIFALEQQRHDGLVSVQSSPRQQRPALFVLRLELGALPEQQRHDDLVPSLSSPQQRRPAQSSPRQRCPAIYILLCLAPSAASNPFGRSGPFLFCFSFCAWHRASKRLIRGCACERHLTVVASLMAARSPPPIAM